ncbi:MAG: hypothetical protein AB3A66_27720 (plasmid) [Nodularia sp. CChRGM 3473]
MLEQMFLGVNIIEKILDQLQEEDRRKHEQKLQELSIIADSNIRDQFAVELLMDKILAPIEKAQLQIHEAAKHAQYMAEVIGYYYTDHGLTQEQAKKISTQFRFLAVQLTEVNSLHNLKLVYRVLTLFLDEISVFKHRERKYSIEHEVRQGILDRLNICIANYENFQRRTISFSGGNQDNTLKADQFKFPLAPS